MRRTDAEEFAGRESPDIDVNSMLLFYDMVNCGSINQAALNLKIPKATISRRLRKLEQQVGAVLVKRGPYKLSMTASGEILYHHCEKIHAEALAARTAVTEIQAELSGRLQVATALGLGPWIHRALAAFALAHPRIEVVVDETHRWIDVTEEPYDVVIHLGRIRNEQIPVRRFTELSRGAYASPQYLSGKAMPRTPPDLLDHSCIVLRQQMDDGLWRFPNQDAKTTLTLKPHARVSNILVAHSMTLAGVGVGVLPHAICVGDVAAQRLVKILPDWKIPPLVPAATYLERRYMPLRIRAFLDTVATQFKQGLQQA